MSGTRQPGGNKEVVVVTATMTLSSHHVGKTILVESSAACTLTMPTPEQCLKGGEMLIINSADQNLIVGLDEKIITKNNLAADSVAYQTAGELIGGAFLMVNTGSKWAALPLAEEAVTITVATD
jgi:hypothetical protein